VCVDLGIQHAVRTRRIIICGLSDSTILSYIILQTTTFGKRKDIEHKTCVLIFSTTFV